MTPHILNGSDVLHNLFYDLFLWPWFFGHIYMAVNKSIDFFQSQCFLDLLQVSYLPPPSPAPSGERSLCWRIVPRNPSYFPSSLHIMTTACFRVFEAVVMPRGCKNNIRVVVPGTNRTYLCNITINSQLPERHRQ